MASRVTLYGKPQDREMKRLKREMSVMYVDYDEVDIDKDANAKRRLTEAVGDTLHLPLVEVECIDSDGSLFLTNPDEPTLRQSLYAERILSVTAYWV